MKSTLSTLLVFCSFTVYSQTVKLPDSLDINATERSELSAYCNKLSKLEKFLLLTADSTCQDWNDEKSAAWYKCNFLKYVDAIKSAHNPELVDANAYSKSIIDKANCYLFFPYGKGDVELAYWNISKDKQLIGVMPILDVCCGGDSYIYGNLRFYIYENGKITSIPTDSVFDTPVVWYEVYSFESYLTLDFAGITNLYYVSTYRLPRKGTDITVSPVHLGCGPESQDYSVYYKWDGDGTFTKVSSQLNRLLKIAGYEPN